MIAQRPAIRFYVALLALSAIFLAGCGGWHLRGDHTADLLPDRQAQVQLQLPLGEFNLRDGLESELLRVNATSAASDADFIVQVQSIESDQITQSLASNLQAAARQVVRTAVVQLVDQRSGASAIAVLTAQRSYDYLANSPAASDAEVALIERDLDRELARQIVVQLGRLAHDGNG